jgi:uncharacterized membrane protein
MVMPNQPTLLSLRTTGMIARVVGIVAIALGFVIGIYGLEDSGAGWLQTALGFLVTGMLAQGYALYCAIKHKQQSHDRSQS